MSGLKTELDGMDVHQQITLQLMADAAERAAYARVDANTIASCAMWIAISMVRNRDTPTGITKEQFIDTVTKQWDSMTKALEQGGPPNASNVKFS